MRGMYITRPHVFSFRLDLPPWWWPAAANHARKSQANYRLLVQHQGTHQPYKCTIPSKLKDPT